MITLKINIENELYANMLAELIANFTFVESVEIPELTKTFHSSPLIDELLILPPKKQSNPSKYYGIWANKNIADLR